jgi:hypothetical protein
MDKSSSYRVINRLIPALALWGVGKALETSKVKGALQEVDSHAYIQKRKAIRSLRRVGRNALSNRAWLAAGAAAIVVGIGLMAKASRGK